MNASSRLEEDRLARLRALDVASFIVEAPAGAGKTELLTQRYLRLLAVVEHPEEVLALTFTNKAATEMRDRILHSLETAAGGVLPEAAHKQQTFHLARTVLAHDGERNWGLLDHPGRLRITTLDALCASLARQMPYLSRFGSQPGVAEDAAAHYATAARRTLEMVEAEGADADVVAAALAFMDNNAGRLENLRIKVVTNDPNSGKAFVEFSRELALQRMDKPGKGSRRRKTPGQRPGDGIGVLYLEMRQ